MKRKIIKLIRYLVTLIVLVSVLFSFSCTSKRYITISAFGSGRVLAIHDNLYGYIDKSGKVAIDYQYDEATIFFNDRAVVKKDGKYFLINNKGKKASGDYDNIRYNYDEKVYIGRVDNKYSVFNIEGKNVIDEGTYDTISTFYDGLSSVSKNGLFGMINIQGKEIIKLKYQYCDIRFVNELLLVSMDNKYGYINKDDELVIPCIYDSAQTFCDGIAMVRIDGRNIVIDIHGNELSVDGEEIVFLKDGHFVTTKDNKYNIYNNDGKLVISDLELLQPIKSEVFYATEDFIIIKDTESVYIYNLAGDLIKKSPEPNIDILYDIVEDRNFYVISTSDYSINTFYRAYSGRLYRLNISDEYRISKNFLFTYKNRFVLGKEVDGEILYGIVNEYGRVVDEFQYKDLYITTDGYYVFAYDNLYGLKNSFDIVFIQPEFEKIFVNYKYGSANKKTYK